MQVLMTECSKNRQLRKVRTYCITPEPNVFLFMYASKYTSLKIREKPTDYLYKRWCRPGLVECGI